jgi:hypothetical protein
MIGVRLQSVPATLERRAVVSGFVTVAAVAGVRSSFAVVLPHLGQRSGVSVASIALAFTVHWITFTVTAPLAWRAFVRLGSARMFRLGGALCGGGFALLATVGATWQAILWFGVVLGVGTHGIGQLASNHPVLVTSAADRRDRRFGVVACGSPVGIAVLPAVTALGTDWFGWEASTVATGLLVVAMSWLAALGVAPIVGARGALPTAVPKAHDPRLWAQPAFILLTGAFFLGLLVQTSVPFIVPLWGSRLDLSATELAAAFLIFGGSGLLGRLAMTSLRPAFSLRLWVAAPAAAFGIAGCLVATRADTLRGLFLAVALLGLSAPVFGALFAIAAVACFPSARYAQVLGSLLIPVGLGAALAPALPAVSINPGISLTPMWLALGAMTACTAALFILGEMVSPEGGARRRAAGAALTPPHSSLASDVPDWKGT